MNSSDEVSLTWHSDEQPPADLPVRQVYGWVLDARARVVLLRDLGRWNLPGGKPEPRDGGDLAATLRREVWEEVQVTLADPVYLGYQSVQGPGEPFAQVRMAARLHRLAERAPDPDPDKNRIHERHLLPLDKALGLLDWGPPVLPQVAHLARVAAERWVLDLGVSTVA
ncbi:NUDIX domain-containing protein [Nocardiopsis sp. NPDC101807]|uniref:NUDIX domain-containing protein n=1 Tax=Nocardiopsis sp. NPDC101807 TaxID=3364339 RepID=UPI0037F540D6